MLGLNVGEIPNLSRFGKSVETILDAADTECPRHVFRGYGMMLAEIGLPPGAEVDRSSLEAVVDDASAGVNRYDVLPDRVVLYL